MNYDSEEKIKKQIKYSLAVFVLAIISYFAFPWKTVVTAPGTKGVYMDKPYFVGDGGIRRHEVMNPGRKWVWKSTDVIGVLDVPYKEAVRIDDFSTKDNYLVDFDSTISLRILDHAAIVAEWKLTFWTQTLQAEYNSIVRREVSKYELYELMSDPVKLAELDKSITDKLSAYIVSIKIPVKVENVALGRAKPTTEVLAQINETARQKEAKATNINKAAAEEQRKESESKRALADKAYANEMGMNPSQFVQLRMVEMQTAACMKATNCVIGLDRITPAGK